MNPLRTRGLLVAAAGLIIVAGSVRLWQRQSANVVPSSKTVRSAMTPMAATVAAEQAVRNAQLPIANFSVASAGEIVVLRGTAEDLASVSRAEELARGAGATRVANMIQVRHRRADDDIRRQAERELSRAPSLSDCRFSVSVDRGVVHVSGRIRSTIQEDVVRSVLRRIDGAVSVETDLAAL